MQGSGQVQGRARFPSGRAKVNPGGNFESNGLLKNTVPVNGCVAKVCFPGFSHAMIQL